MSYCTGTGMAGWFDDLLQAGEKIATTVTRQSTPVGYGTTYPTGTPPMFPPTYGVANPQYSMNLAPDAFMAMLPYLIIGGVVLYFVMNRGKP